MIPDQLKRWRYAQKRRAWFRKVNGGDPRKPNGPGKPRGVASDGSQTIGGLST